MNRAQRFENKRLKHVVALQRTRSEDEAQGPYIGLENIESWTGRLAVDPDTHNGDGPGVDGTDEQSQSSTFQRGAVLFGKLRPYLAKAWIADRVGHCTTEALVMQPVDLESRFLLYVVLQPSFIDAVDSSTYGSKMPRADWDFIGGVRVPVPTREQQRTIAAFLDHETARLDALVAAKQRVLDLLAEKRKAIITTAVTRGLDLKVTLRDSGVPWLGEIPAHWKTKRMKYLFRLVADRAPLGNDFELLSLYTDIGVKPRRELEERGNKASTTDEYWLVQPGDLIVNKLLAWMGAFGVSSYSGVTSPAYDILRPQHAVEPFYYHHLFRCGVATTEVRARSYGIMDMRLRLYFDRLGDMYVPCPDHEEQQAIVEYITRETARIDAVRTATERTVELLKERRAALIAAAVTGQLDLRAAA